jgi:methionine-rich copper-binding protein CopC
VEVPFSTFKVYPLTSDEEDPVRLRAAASALVQQVLNLRNDAAQRADEGVTTQARISAEINIALKKELPPGRYVVMWRVLSIDTHTTTGFFVFTYAP